MMRILEAQAPAKQNATDTIQTLSGRLTSATLLEDRRAAIQGLRSFAKLYPASVASGALRDLIAALRKDADDSDTIKIVLETLLGLFEPDEKSPEASEEITLWLADEFTQRQDNITALLDLLEANEFYLRLYVLQILSHISTARPQRTQEAVFAAPLGVSRITNVLDDRREAVRNEALILLVALTPTSAEIQKVVAFENAFDRAFALVDGDGGLTHGSTTVQDCLSLLANLLNLNTSNQSYFREVGGILKLKKLLSDAVEQEDSVDGVSEWMKSQRDMNVWGLLGVVQLFLPQGAQGTLVNQQAFWQSGALEVILHIAFHPAFSISVRTKSLQTCGDIIRANHGLQERFGDLGVLIKEPDSPTTNGHNANASPEKKHQPQKATFRTQNVIESLLELSLEPAPLAMFDVRLAASSCVEAFMNGHPGIRTHVLRRAIDGHKAGDDAIPNMLTVLLDPPTSRSNSDPYQQWFAAVLLLHLLSDNTETKQQALKVTEGDAESGEEVVTFLQSITSNVVAGVQHVEDERALLGYLMLLAIWLFEDPEAVNDLLGEGSNVQGLIAAVKITKNSMPLVAGLSAFVLGIIYEFSTKDSPVPRSTLHGLLVSNLGREAYVDRLTKLRENPFIRDFEVLPQTSNGALPDVFFDKTFVDFFKDNYSRFLRAIDRDPNFEVSILSNGVQKGVSRDLVDSLRAQVEEQKQALETANGELLQLKRRLEQEELDHRRTRESATVELSRIKAINQSLHDNNEDEVRKLQQEASQERSALVRSHEEEATRRRNEHISAIETARKQHEADVQQFEQRLKLIEQENARERASLTEQHRRAMDEAGAIAQKARDREAAEISDLQHRIAELESLSKKANANHVQDLETAHEEYKTKLEGLEARLQRAHARAADAESRLTSLSDELEKEKSGKKDVQTELDDLLVVFADLEAKRSGDKQRLKDLGEEVSDDEDEEGVEDNDDDDEEDVD
ncbi:Vesicle-mediated ER to Golgi transport protein [Cladophialophora chaetospira]|uniref:Vesicle-mediated ER to Golgi transport protein n=1 Tax=Cladophialophora chaetospira TaxID=386627 RepID=A0AA38XLW9_9EURO|nr:Vesicle-mediated ER to Golgi transport protein [Cladophialophora chaetospira]